MLLVDYCYGIRSERRICEEVNFNLAYRWFYKLGLEDEVPDHSSFSKNRHGRFRGSGLFGLIFDSVVHSCHQQGLIKAEGFPSDASYIKADASRQRMENGSVNWTLFSEQSRALKDYIEALNNDPALRRTKKKSL
jgi:transposase